MTTRKFLFFLSVMALFIFITSADAATGKNAASAHVSDLRVYQLGSTELVLEFIGENLRLPIVENADGYTAFIFNDTNFKPDSKDNKEFTAYKKRKNEHTGESEWIREFGVPLAESVTITKPTESSAEFRIYGEEELIVKKSAGRNGRIRFILQEKAEMPPETKRRNKPALLKGDPQTISEPITIEARAVSTHDILRNIAEIRGYNLLLAPSVPSSEITLSFRQVPFNQVFSYIISMNSLKYRYDGKTLVIGSADEIAELTSAKATREYKIAYADVKKLPEIITSLIPVKKAPVIDERIRALYIEATEEQHEMIKTLLERVDSPGKQVLIEARLVEFSQGTEKEFETMLSAVYNGWIFSYGAATGVSAAYTYGNGAVTPNVNPTQGYSQGEIPVVGTDELINPMAVADSTIKALDVGLRALETDNKGKILAAPSVAAIDGHKALVKLTQKYLYQSGVDHNNNPQFSSEETGPVLEFTPLVGNDGYITINLKISEGEIITFRQSGVSEAPVTTKREVVTQIRVRDGELFVIGGLYRENKTKNASRVPILSYIPLLGELFKATYNVNEKSQMAFIAIPHIIDNASYQDNNTDLF